MYTYWKRTGPTPVMMALDASKRDVCTVRRERTDSPSQSLILLNGTQFVEAARAFADQLIIKHGTENPAGLINDAFRQLTSRYPSEKEAIILLQFLVNKKINSKMRKRQKNSLRLDTTKQNPRIFPTWQQ